MAKQKTYVVTGGAGFIGSHIAKRLLDRGDKVVVVDNLYAGFRKFVPDHPDCTFVEVDISDWGALSKAFANWQGATGVFHTAACSRIQPSIIDPSLTNDYNVTGTMNVLQMMRLCGVDNIVYSGSSSYYGGGAKVPCQETDPGNPETPYAITKRMGEEYCQTWSKIYGTHCAILRYFNVYGRRSPLLGSYAPVVGLFFKQVLEGKDVSVVGDGEQRRDFTHVGDVVTANFNAMDVLDGPSWKKIDGEVFNIGTGTNHSINEIAKAVVKALKGWKTDIVHVPARPGEARETLADNSKADNYLRWEPTISLEEGIKDLTKYYLDHRERLIAGIYDF